MGLWPCYYIESWFASMKEDLDASTKEELGFFSKEVLGVKYFWYFLYMYAPTKMQI